MQALDILSRDTDVAPRVLERGHGDMSRVGLLSADAEFQTKEIFPGQLWVIDEGRTRKDFLKRKALLRFAVGKSGRRSAEGGNLRFCRYSRSRDE